MTLASQTKSIELTGSEQTLRIGEVIGQRLIAGELIALNGPLGAGKTTLTQGIARGLGVPDNEPIVSPTFVLLREYTGRLRLAHLDAYRIGSYEEFSMLGLDELRSEGWAAVVEWADRFPELMDAADCRIELAHVSPTQRRIEIDWPRVAVAGWPGSW